MLEHFLVAKYGVATLSSSCIPQLIVGLVISFHCLALEPGNYVVHTNKQSRHRHQKVFSCTLFSGLSVGPFFRGFMPFSLVAGRGTQAFPPYWVPITSIHSLLSPTLCCCLPGLLPIQVFSGLLSQNLSRCTLASGLGLRALPWNHLIKSEH